MAFGMRLDEQMLSARSRFLLTGAALIGASVLVVVGFRHPHSPSAAGPPPVRPVSLPNPASVERSLRAIEDGERQSPRDRWDPVYIVEQVGRDPRALYAWVHDNTYWVPYRGVLRGPVGVLMDRQGNSLDRAALLAKLLKTAGYETRLAHGELSEQAAGKLLPGLVFTRHSAFNESRTPVSLPTDSELRALATRYAQAATPLVTQLDGRVSEQKRRLLSLVQTPDAHDERAQRTRFAIGSLRDHWWVQWQDGATWRDLDLLAPPDLPSLTAARETRGLPEIEQTSFHRITLRVIAEFADGGKPTERTVLENTFWPAALLDKSIVLQLWPTHWPQDVAQDPESPYGLRTTALDQHEWSATLQFGSEVVAQAVFTDDDEPTAVWIEYEIHVPGASARKERRAVFDLLGPAARANPPAARFAADDAARLTRSLALMMRTEILPLPCALSPQFVTHVIAQNLQSSGDLLRAISRNQFDLQSESVQKAMDRAPPPVSTLYALALARTAWSRAAADTYIDRPALLTRHRFLKPTEHGVVYEDATDIVTNELGVDLAVRDAFPVRMEQGVFDSNAESLLQGSAATASASAAFATTRDWLTLTAAEKADVARLNLNTVARARIAADLDAGYTVVVPKEPMRTAAGEYTGWWRVDPRTGDALGILDNGWGASMSEYSVLLNVMIAGARGFWFDALMCHGAPIAMNELLAARSWIHENLSTPSWTRDVAHYEAQDDLDIIMANLHKCVWQGLVAGALSTVPLLLLQSRWGLRASSAEVSLEDAAVDSSRPTRPPNTPPLPPRQPTRPAAPTLPSMPDQPGVNPKPQGPRPAPDPVTAPSEPTPTKPSGPPHAPPEDTSGPPTLRSPGNEAPGTPPNDDPYYDGFMEKTYEPPFPPEDPPIDPELQDLIDALVPTERLPTPRPAQPGGPVTLTEPPPSTVRDYGDTLPGGRPPPVYAPVRYGPSAPNPTAPGDISGRTFIGLGGLDPPR
jgi:hypothetical protein